MSHRPPSPVVTGSLIALLCLIWGSTWWAIRVGLEDLPPLTAAAFRFAIAGVAMTLLVIPLRKRESGRAPPVWLWSSMGALNIAASYGIVYWTETRVASGVVAVLWAIYPMLMAIIGHTMLGERLGRRQTIGFLVSFVGTVAMFFGDLGGGEDVLGYALLVFVSPLVCAISVALVKRHGEGCSSLLLTRNGILFGAALLAAAAWLVERDAPMHFGPRAWISTLYLALFGSALAFGVYFWLLRTARASRLSLISYVTPPLALTLGWLVGDGELDLMTILGTSAIVVGIALVVDRPGSSPVPRRAERSPDEVAQGDGPPVLEDPAA